MTHSIDLAILNHSIGHSKIRQLRDALNRSSYSQQLKSLYQWNTATPSVREPAIKSMTRSYLWKNNAKAAFPGLSPSLQIHDALNISVGEECYSCIFRLKGIKAMTCWLYLLENIISAFSRLSQRHQIHDALIIFVEEQYLSCIS